MRAQTGRRLSVGELLQNFAGLDFYVDDYLCSTRQLPYLSRRFRSFLSHLSGSAEEYSTALLAHIGSGCLLQIPGYSSFLKTEHLSDLPFVTKSDLRNTPERFTAPARRGERRWLKMTTGTTGTPVRISYAEEFYFEILLLSVRKVAARAGMLNSIGIEPILCFSLNDKKNAEGMVVAHPADECGFTVQKHIDEGDKDSFRAAFELLEQLKPECIASKPSLLEQFCSFGVAHGMRISSPPTFVLTSGSVLRAGVRDIVTKFFAAPVLDVYTMTEFGVIASQCQAGSLHIDTTSVHVEVVDEGDGLVAEGTTGELVISSIANSAMPLLRYRTGDTGALTSARCDCGALGPRIIKLAGKEISCFCLADGSLFSPTFFNDLFARFPSLREFQMTQRTTCSFQLIAEFSADCDPEQKSKDVQNIGDYVRSSIPGLPKVDVESGLLPRSADFRRYRTVIEA